MRIPSIAALPLALFVLGAVGCAPQGKVGIDHSSPRLLAVSINDAVEKRDFAAMAEACDPNFRPAARKMLMAAKDYIRSLESLASAVERRIGASEGERFRKRAADIYSDFMPSPFVGAAAGGKVDWEKVTIFEEGETTAVTVAGVKSRFDEQFYLRRIKDGWYVVPRQPKDIPPAQRRKSYEREAEYVAETFGEYRKLTDDLAKRIRGGSINRRNYEQKMAALGAAIAPLPTTRPTPGDQ